MLTVADVFLPFYEKEAFKATCFTLFHVREAVAVFSAFRKTRPWTSRVNATSC
jgi:hypothetical protein